MYVLSLVLKKKLLFLQIPVAVGASGYEAVSLYTGRRVIASKGEAGTNFKWHQLVLYCCYGIVAGMVGGLLGLGGGFILGPLFLELGIPPQVQIYITKQQYSFLRLQLLYKNS